MSYRADRKISNENNTVVAAADSKNSSSVCHKLELCNTAHVHAWDEHQCGVLSF